MKGRLLEGGDTLAQDVGEQQGDETEGATDGDDAQGTEDLLDGVAAAQAGADQQCALGGPLGAGGLNVGHYSYCSRKRRTM